MPSFEILTCGEVLSEWIRLALALAGVGVSALIFWNDFRDLKVPDWVANLSGGFIIALWVYILTDFSLIGILTVAATFLLLYSFTRIPLEIVASLASIGGGDARYASILALLLPSPVLWGSPFHFVPSIAGAIVVDYAVNVALVFAITGVVMRTYTYFRGEFGSVPFTPVVGVVFVTTVCFGAWWRPVIMPLVGALI